MVSINNLTKEYGARALFRDASISFGKGNVYGVVGANGSGKSSLLRILSGEETQTSGEVSIPRKCRVGVLKQDHFEYENVPIIEVVMRGHEIVWEAMQQKDKLLENADEEFDAENYSRLEDLILQHDGYALEARAAEVLDGLNIPAELHHEPLSILSGGFKLRALLAQVLAGLPDLLLLDEPTNHLDIVSIRWLEKFLEKFKGCSIVVSHDHRFLNNICTHIVDVDYERVTLYRGNYNAFIDQKQADRDRLEAEIEKRESEIAKHKQMVDRFKAKPTKARQAKSKAKQMDRIEINELPRSSRRYPTFKFAQKRPSGKAVVEVEGVSKIYDDKIVLNEVGLRVNRGERVAIIGPNGIGKSTLLKVMMGAVEPDEGESEWGYEVHLGYFAQDHQDIIGSSNATLQSWLWDFCPGEPIGYVRGKLAEVLFQKDEAEKQVGKLSGGEAARLIFSKLSVQHPNTLVLDEPTNHLDLEGIEALAGGLKAFDGTVLFVSHDRWFVSQLATRIIELRPDGIEDFQGSYVEYLEACGDDHLDADAVLKRAKAQAKESKRARS